MKNRQLLLALPAALLLVAMATFLPERISLRGDHALFDTPHLIAEDTEGRDLSESVQLALPEKLLLLRSGSLSTLSVGAVEFREDIFNVSTNETETLVNGQEAGERLAWWEEQGYAPEEAEDAAVWAGRLASVRRELLALQTAGALPALWDASSTLTLGNPTESIYVDNESKVAFSVYGMTLNCAPYSLQVRVDAQTGRVIAFGLWWEPGAKLNWGANGAASFGDAWRSYWGMDTVDSSWRSAYIQGILTQAEETANGDSSLGGVNFTYDGQSLEVLVYCQHLSKDRQCVLLWNGGQAGMRGL